MAAFSLTRVNLMFRRKRRPQFCDLREKLFSRRLRSMRVNVHRYFKEVHMLRLVRR